MSLNIFRVINFGPSLMTLTHKLGIWNILLCMRKRNAAKIYYKVYRAWDAWEQRWIICFGSLSRFWIKFYSLWNFIAKLTEITFVWLMLWKDMVIRYSTVWTLKHSCLVIKNIIYEKVFPLWKYLHGLLNKAWKKENLKEKENLASISQLPRDNHH